MDARGGREEGNSFYSRGMVDFDGWKAIVNDSFFRVDWWGMCVVGV